MPLADLGYPTLGSLLHDLALRVQHPIQKMNPIPRSVVKSAAWYILGDSNVDETKVYLSKTSIS